jgi:EAL domain-containing protein (putative c-di-GMP-specific phosphodiesterase class I)
MAQKEGFLQQLSVCSVNLSGVSMSDETMLAFISEQFNIWGIPAHKICFEVTETAAIANLSYATNFIHQLRDKGCSFSLDDFGSGLSSFAYLKNLPVDYLKIDGLFVKDILDDKVDLAMVKSINEVGHVMDKKTIAEFVENEQIYNLLNVLGVDYAQGYGIGKPVPLDELKLIKPFMVLPK